MRVPKISLTSGLLAKINTIFAVILSINIGTNKFNTPQPSQFHLWWCQVCGHGGLKKKFVLLLLVFMVIPTCAISAWMYKQVTDTWIEQEYNNQSNELGTILKTTELRLEDLEQIIYDFYRKKIS